jgi:hypothetical protein
VRRGAQLRRRRGLNPGHRFEAFVVNQRNGKWGKAIEVPGLGPLNATKQAYLSSLSCASAGNCAADGYYSDSGGRSQGFVVSEKNGTWGKAIEVPGLGALNTTGAAQVISVSCGSEGNCAAGGVYDQFTDITANGVVYIGSDDGNTYAFGLPAAATAINRPGRNRA